MHNVLQNQNPFPSCPDRVRIYRTTQRVGVSMGTINCGAADQSDDYLLAIQG